MKTLLILIAALAAFFSPGAWAESVSVRRGSDSVILVDQVCPANVLAHIQPEYHPVFFKATAMLNGKALEGCWTIADKDTVVVIFENGDGVAIPADLFKPEHGA